jgi:Stress responsive A/B Barrel Domain
MTLKADAPPETATTIAAALRKLPAQIPCIQGYEVGVDLGLSPGNASIGVVARFQDEAGFREYQDHPAHLAVIDNLITPVRESRTAIQVAL